MDIAITHSGPTDLVITLTSPAGTVLTLSNRESSAKDNLVGTFPTTFNSVDSLSLIAQESMNGHWTLTAEDVDVGPFMREGLLNSSGIKLTEEVTANSPNSPITADSLTNGKQYSCMVRGAFR